MTIPPLPRCTIAGAKWWHHRFGRLDRVGEERLEVRVGAGTVDQKADLKVLGGVGDRCRRTWLREINGESSGFGTRAGFDAGGDVVENGLAPRQQHDVDAALGESFGERGADTV